MFPPNIDPQIYSLSAAIIGAAISPELTPNEANSVGNWIVLVGDYLLAYAGQLALIQGREQKNKKEQNTMNQNSQMDAILKTLKKMECEIERLKKEGFNNHP